MTASNSRPSAGLRLPLLRGRLAGRCLAALLVGGLAAVVAPSLGAGCVQQPVVTATRSLEQSGRVSFLCLDKPESNAGTPISKARPISDCTTVQVLTTIDYSRDVDAGADGGVDAESIPHLYAMVTQTTRGEVAVVDMTAQNNSVLDADPKVPGANFLPVGAQPIDIVSTPDSLATFVSVAEIGREGIFVIPSLQIPRPTKGNEFPDPNPNLELSTWPSCRLPSAPGQMVLIDDPKTRESCDAAEGGGGAGGGTASSVDDLTQGGKKRPKLVVTLPDNGGIAVLDAQTLFALPGGAFDACPIERWVPLQAEVPALTLPAPPDENACKNPEQLTPAYKPGITARPSGISYAAGRLYVSDIAAPLIHVIDLPTPCEPVEIEPLWPFSAKDPRRVVTTTRLAVSPALTPELKRYLYAVDAEDGSAMVFDVSEGATSRLPISRPHPEWNPFDPPDRVTFSAPIADLVVVQRDVPAVDPETGLAVEGIRCDPNPALACADPSKTPCDVGAIYRTSSTYDLGAGPMKLRGVFALLALTSGKIAVIDVDDYDAPCRGPTSRSSLFGCEPQCTQDSDCRAGACTDGVCSKSCQKDSDCPALSGCSSNVCVPVATKELSCNAVLPNAPRMSTYNMTGTLTTQREAGIQTYPLLYDKNGSLITPTNNNAVTGPRMIATLPPSAEATQLDLLVGTQVLNIAGESQDNPGAIIVDGVKNTLVMNREDPRAQLIDQGWSVTFEGAIPGFRQQVGDLRPRSAPVGDGAPVGDLEASDSRFCDAGVQSEQSVREQLKAGTSDEDIKLRADFIQLANALPIEEDLYWKNVAKNGGPSGTCSFNACKAIFGDIDTPLTGRDFLITEAYQDHVELRPRDLALQSSADAEAERTRVELSRCCFPTPATFNVRAGSQWVVSGDASGFLHHVIADPNTGVCRNSCDPFKARQNGRVVEAPSGKVVHDGDPEGFAFINPMFRFAVKQGEKGRSQRDDQFRFVTQGSFVPLLINIATDTRTLIQPAAIAVVPLHRQEIAVTDGALSGITLVNLSSAAAIQQYY